MIGDAELSLSDKQQAVLQRIDRRVPIKIIANELGVSETRINQHIRALKRIFGVSSLNELVECYREQIGGDENDVADTPFRNDAYSKKQLNVSDFMQDQTARDDPGSIRVSDAHVVARDAPWAHDIEPVVVFGALDGENAVLYRFGLIIGIAFSMIAALVLVVSAGLAISKMLEGRAAIPVDKHGVAD